MAAHRPPADGGGASLTALTLTVAAAIGAGVAGVVSLAIRRHARALGLLDAPNERSSHRVITPRGGGLAIIIGSAVSLACLAAMGEAGRGSWILFTGAASLGLVGAVDDRRSLSPSVRLAVQLVVAFAAVWFLGPVSGVPFPSSSSVMLPAYVAWPFTILWLVTVTNFFNFMDGIDGLAAGQAIATCAGVAVAGWALDATALALVVAVACVGFLSQNWPPARLFMGDSGSGFLGFVLAGMPLLAPPGRRSEAMLAVAIGLALFLLDPLVTLVRRARAGKRITQAHREHLYQQLVGKDEPAGPVTRPLVATAFALALLGAAGYHRPSLLWIGCIASLAAFAVLRRSADRARQMRTLRT